jgi:dihydrofolate synthase/folylpolyglutamate synthase
VDYLDRHVHLGVKPGLERMRGILELMGNPERAYPIVHITGTNGKTTTARIVSALVAAHGLTPGTFVSPHLQRVEERLARHLMVATPEEFAQAITDVAGFVDVWTAQGGAEPTYFELTALAAFSWFATEAVDVGVIEVGLGGRLDATNTADGAVAVVTGVAREHTEYLGDTVEEITTEKVAIAKPGAVLVTGPIPPEAGAVAATRAGEVDIPHRRYGVDFLVAEARLAVGGWLVDVDGVYDRYPEVFLPLHGHHQTVNFAIAVVAVEELLGRPLSLDAVRQGAAGITAPGRLEVVRRHPLVLLDGAHNEQGFAALDETLADEFGVRSWVLVIGVMGDKDREAMIRQLHPRLFSAAIATAAQGARPVAPEDLARSIRAVWGEAVPVETAQPSEAALLRALDLAGVDGAVVVAGSLYLAGELRGALGFDEEGMALEQSYHPAARPEE